MRRMANHTGISKSERTLSTPARLPEIHASLFGIRRRAIFINNPFVRLIPLSQGLFAIVDMEDYEKVVRYKWCASKARNTYYAQRTIRQNGNRRSCLMHRVILDAPAGQEIDHVNACGWDNRRANLRFATTNQNHQNMHNTWGKSKFKGVTWNTKDQKWRARISGYWLGNFDCELEAAAAYDAAAERLFGEYACLNRNLFPEAFSPSSIDEPSARIEAVSSSSADGLVFAGLPAEDGSADYHNTNIADFLGGCKEKIGKFPTSEALSAKDCGPTGPAVPDIVRQTE